MLACRNSSGPTLGNLFAPLHTHPLSASSTITIVIVQSFSKDDGADFFEAFYFVLAAA